MKTFNQIKEKQHIVRKDNNGQVELATVMGIHEIGTDSFIFSVKGVISKQRTEFKADGSATEVTVDDYDNASFYADVECLTVRKDNPEDDKIYCLSVNKTFRDESYGDPEITLCTTREIAHREFLQAVEAELDEYLDDDDLDYINDELYENGELKEGDEPKTLDDLTLQEKIDFYSEHHFDVSFSDELGNEYCSFDTSDESSVSFSITESKVINK
jgi:hypothetical protein